MFKVKIKKRFQFFGSIVCLLLVFGVGYKLMRKYQRVQPERRIARKMATYLNENFDSTAVGAAPASMTLSNLAVESAVGVSGANGLGISVASSAGRGFTTATDGAGGDGRVRMAFRLAANNTRIGVFLRHNGGDPSSYTAYSASIALGGSAGNAGIAVHRWAGASATTLGAEDLFASSFSLNAWYAFDATAVGSTLSVGVQRASDASWLQSDGTWGATVARPIVRTDSTLTGASHAGVLAFGAIGAAFGDDLYFTDVSDTTGVFVAASSGISVVANSGGAYWAQSSVAFDGSGGATVIDNGTYCKFGFSGTSLALNLDVSTLKGGSIPVANWGSFLCVIDGKVAVKTVLTDPGSGLNALRLPVASGLASGAHTAEIWRDIVDESNEWTPVSAVKVVGFQIDSGTTLTAPSGLIALRSKRGLVMGDSVVQGYATTDSPYGTNFPPATFAQLLMRGLDMEAGQVGKSGQGWLHAGTGSETGGLAFPATWNFLSNGVARNLSGLDYLVVAGMGTNDTADVTSTVQTWLVAARAAVGASCWIVLSTPFSANASTAQIKAAVAAYLVAHPADLKTVVVDPGTVLALTALNPGGAPDALKLDGIHPNSTGQAMEAAVLTGLILRATAGTSTTVGSTSGVTLDLTQPLGTGAWATTTVGEALKASWIQGKGRWVVSGSNLRLYAPDGTTVEKSFTLNSPTAPTERL